MPFLIAPRSLVYYGVADKSTDQVVIIKCSQLSLKRERDILQVLACPRGIPETLEYHEIEDWEVLIMEYTGVDLSSISQHHGADNRNEIAVISAPVVCYLDLHSFDVSPTEHAQIHILEHIHNRGIIHSDIKPANITLLPINPAKSTAECTIYIIDFGLSCTSYEDEERGPVHMDMHIGSALYMSPWIHRGLRPCRRDDLFSAAVTFLALCKGESKLPWRDAVVALGEGPLSLEDHAHIASLKEVALMDSDFFDDLPPVFQQFYKYALSLKHAERPAYYKWFTTFLGSRERNVEDISPTIILKQTSDLLNDAVSIVNSTGLPVIAMALTPVRGYNECIDPPATRLVSHFITWRSAAACVSHVDHSRAAPSSLERLSSSLLALEMVLSAFPTLSTNESLEGKQR
ncbi:hypothetical protein NM688_g1907 [Phlebia brevispora]|uniref:Uncharacterized protein n=1 Tax=Phlebia brevispora TaxID=194682 RepID=A0ACC1TA92_9APHY|nr:hypothetical protein NM688_g1907 [Phlebia brevispora]